MALDWEYRYVFVNKAALAFAGQSEEAILGHSFWEFLPNLEGTPQGRAVREAMELGKFSVFEHASVSSGDWVESRVYPTTTGITIFSRVINERKRRELERDELFEALQESESRFGAMFAKSPFALALSSMPGAVLTEVNPAFERLFGFTRDELLGKTSPELAISDGESPLQVDREIARQGFVHDFECVRRTKSGDEVWLSLNVDTLTIGGEEYLLTTVQDITRRKLAEEASRESRALLQAVIEGTPDPVFVKDRKSRILLANPAVLGVWDKPLEEVLGKTDRELYPDPAVGEAVMANDRRVIDSGSTQVIEETVQTPEGSRTYLSTKTPHRDSSGEIVGVLGIARDITERKRAEDALSASEERYHLLFEGMMDGYAYCRMLYAEGRPVDFVYLDVNAAFERLTGLEGVVGRNVSEVIPGIQNDNPELFEIYGRVAMSGAPESFETFLPALDIWFSVSVYRPMPDHFVAVFENVTARKRAEDTLRESEEKYRAMVETAGEGIVLARPDLTSDAPVRAPSQPFQETCGLSPDLRVHTRRPGAIIARAGRACRDAGESHGASVLLPPAQGGSDRELPGELDLHLILDNYQTHKHADVDAWLEKHPRFSLHFTPTSSSWLNLSSAGFASSPTRRCVVASLPACPTWSLPSRPTSTLTTRAPGPSSGPPPWRRSWRRSGAVKRF